MPLCRFANHQDTIPSSLHQWLAPCQQLANHNRNVDEGTQTTVCCCLGFLYFFLFLFINCSFFFFTIRLHLRYKHDIKLPPPHIITITIGKTGGSRCSLFQSGESLTNTYHIKAHLLTSCNKLCFTNGYIEISVNLPGSTTAQGSWPGVSLF